MIYLWKVVRERFVVMENRMEMAYFQGYCIVNVLLWEMDTNMMFSWKVVCIDFC